MESKDLVHLDPNILKAHPIIQQFEDEGIFSYSPGEMDRLTESVQKDGFLQPILVTPDGNGGYHRIAGKMRVEAAKSLKCSVPAYVRHFPDEQSVISAAKAENFRRRLWDPARVMKEEQAIEKLLSRWTKKRIASVKKLHPSLLELCKKGVLRHRADERLIEDLKTLSMEAQQNIAAAITEVIETKMTAGKNTAKDRDSQGMDKARKELEEITQKYKNLEDKYSEDTERLEAEIQRLENLLKEEKQYDPDSPVIESWRKEVKKLKEELSAKEGDLNKLRRELNDAVTAQSRPADDLMDQRAKLILDATDKLFDDINSGLKTYIQHIDRTINDLPKDTLIVSNDKLGKLWKLIETNKQKISSVILKRLEALEPEKEEKAA